MKTETRFASEPVSVEKREGKGSVITGYAAVFYDGTSKTEFKMAPGLVERMMPTAFDEAMQTEDVRGLFNHSPAVVLGRTKAGTMTLTKDTKGLRYEIEMPETTAAKDLAISLARGDVTGSSIAFNVRGQAGQRVLQDADGKTFIRELHNVSLRDVGPVTFPAYDATSAGVRSLDDCDADLKAAIAAAKAKPPASVSTARRLRLQLRERE